jgi:hypothetical protein
MLSEKIMGKVLTWFETTTFLHTFTDNNDRQSLYRMIHSHFLSKVVDSQGSILDKVSYRIEVELSLINVSGPKPIGHIIL